MPIVDAGGSSDSYAFALAQPSDIADSPFAYLFRDDDDAALQVALAAASRSVEGMVNGRLLPFQISEEVRLSADTSVWQPTALVTWVSQSATYRSELWAGALVSLMVRDVFQGQWIGVDITTADFNASDGAVRFSYGPPFTTGYGWMYPEPTRARVTYTGGYPTGSVPEELVRATIFRAAASRLRVVEAGDQKDSSSDLELEVQDLLTPWRGQVPASFA